MEEKRKAELDDLLAHAPEFNFLCDSGYIDTLLDIANTGRKPRYMGQGEYKMKLAVIKKYNLTKQDLMYMWESYERRIAQ